jgi:hypothetical protein
VEEEEEAAAEDRPDGKRKGMGAGGHKSQQRARHLPLAPSLAY